MTPSFLTITQISPPMLSGALGDLTEILHACVHDGGSVGFILPFDEPTAAQFWSDKVFPAVQCGNSVLFVARVNDHIVGTVQLGLGLPPNQPHRADVLKLLVHPDQRRKGIARALMQTLIGHASELGKSLLVLDTRSGDPSQQLYEDMGFLVAGEIPGFCRNPLRDGFEATCYLYKNLTPVGLM